MNSGLSRATVEMGDRMLCAAQVCEITTWSRTTLWRRIRAGEFRPPRRLGPNRVGWLASEVAEWVATRPSVRREKP